MRVVALLLGILVPLAAGAIPMRYVITLCKDACGFNNCGWAECAGGSVVVTNTNGCVAADSNSSRFLRTHFGGMDVTGDDTGASFAFFASTDCAGEPVAQFGVFPQAAPAHRTTVAECVAHAQYPFTLGSGPGSRQACCSSQKTPGPALEIAAAHSFLLNKNKKPFQMHVPPQARHALAGC
jgi:hypothetical protein